MPLAYTRLITDRDKLCQKLIRKTLAGLVPASPCTLLKMEIAAQGREGLVIGFEGQIGYLYHSNI